MRRYRYGDYLVNEGAKVVGVQIAFSKATLAQAKCDIIHLERERSRMKAKDEIAGRERIATEWREHDGIYIETTYFCSLNECVYAPKRSEVMSKERAG